MCLVRRLQRGDSFDSDRVSRHAPLPHPHLRRAPRQRHRQGRAAVRLVPSHPRPWRPAVHRPARPLRPDPGGRRPRQPGLQGRRDAARRMGGADRRQGAPRGPRAPRIPSCRPARSRSTSPRSRCWGRPASCRCRCSAIRNILRKSGSSTASSTCAASKLHHNIMTRGAIIDSIRRRMKEQGFFEFQTPILTASSPGGRARLSWCRRASIRASSTRCRRRRSSSSSSS